MAGMFGGGSGQSARPADNILGARGRRQTFADMVNRQVPSLQHQYNEAYRSQLQPRGGQQLGDHNSAAIAGYLGGGLSAPTLSRGEDGYMYQGGATKGDLVGSRGQYYWDRQAQENQARQSVEDSQRAFGDRYAAAAPFGQVTGSQWGSRYNPGPDATAGPQTSGAEVPLDYMLGRSEVNPRGGTYANVDGKHVVRSAPVPPDVKAEQWAHAREVQQKQLDKRRERSARSDADRFRYRNPGRKLPLTISAKLEEHSKPSEAFQYASALKSSFEGMLGKEGADPAAMQEGFIRRIESLYENGFIGDEEYQQLFGWGATQGLVPDGLAPRRGARKGGRTSSYDEWAEQDRVNRVQRDTANSVGAALESPF